MFGQQFYDSANADLFVVVESLEPASEFVGALNFPSHASLCHGQHNASRVILTAMLRSAPVKSLGPRQEVTRGTANVFADLGFPDASERQVKLRLAYALNKVLDERHHSVAGAANALGITRASVSAVRGYKLSGFSVERLMKLLTALGLDVQITIRRKPRSRTAAKISVVGA
jgi:predicted XRE-type DNA-binding protein